MKPDGDRKEANPQGNFLLKNKKILMITAICLVALAIAAAGFFLWPGIGNGGGMAIASYEPTAGPTVLEEVETEAKPVSQTRIGLEVKKPFELIPEDSDETGTATDSGYRILLDQIDYTVEELTNNISISPKTGFTIKKKAENEFLLTPLSLRPNQVYSVHFADETEGMSYSWAFQTRNEFFVTSTLPRDQATYVPENTGIEITFSQPVENDLSSHFEINPKVHGRFETHKNTVVFVPTVPLTYDTVYTITIQKGFAFRKEGLALQKDTVFAFQTMPEPENEKDGESDESFNFARNVYNFYDYEIPLISVYTNLTSTSEVEFNLYRYLDEKDFQEDIFIKDDRPYWCVHYSQPINDEGKELVLSMNTTFLHDQPEEDEWAYYKAKFIQLPDSLPEGHYVAVIKRGDVERKTYIQVNGLAVYVGSLDNKTIAMVYESKTAMPVEGAQIIFENHTMTTGADGLAVSDYSLFDGESSRLKNYIIKRAGHPEYYAAIGESYYSSRYGYDYDSYYGYSDNFYLGKIKDQYWGYLFTDRDMYMPDDTVFIWGMLTGKDGGTAPGKATITLSGYSYYASEEYAVIDEKEVVLSGTNTFQCSISYENLSQGYYNLEVHSGDAVLLSKDILVRKYAKPIYTINTSVDKQNVIYGEKVEFEMETKFFEGTPVYGMNFNYTIDGLSTVNNTGSLKTDGNGRASLAVEAIGTTQSWRPFSAWIRVTNADPEETSVNAYESLTVFPRDTMIKVQSRTNQEKTCTVDIVSNKINIDGIRNKEWYREEEYTGVPTNVTVNVELFETWYTSTQTGTWYNFIEKKTYPKYRYDRHERKMQTYQVNTMGGKGSFSFPKEDEKGYYAIFSCVDGNGRPITQKEYLHNYYYNNEPSWREIDYYYLEMDKDFYSADDDVKASLYCKDEPVQKAKNKKVLFMLLRKGLLDYTLSDDPAYTFSFQKDYIPNAGVMAVYFDGKNVTSTSVHSVYYQKEDRRLNIDVKPAKQQYQPGDTATFTLNVTDPSGKGRKAEVLFSIVDEAYFALWDQSVDILNSIYSQNVSYGYNSGSIPHTNSLEDYEYYGGAEGGEGGDEGSGEIRSDFKDTALFESVTTDENGHGKVSVKLPDNLTKWRVTFLGITDDLYAGDGTLNVDVRLPYFINTVFNDIFITGDKPVLQVRSFGTEAKDGEKVDYTVNIIKDGAIWNRYSISSTIGQRAYVEIDQLEEGDYSYTVTGKYGKYQDAIQLPFEVLPGFIEQSLTEYQPLSENMVFPETKWPAKVYFINEHVKEYWNELMGLAYSWSKRVDSIIVRKQARTLLKEFFKDEWVQEAQEYDISQYQLTNGGIALLPYDSASPVLTAKICALNDGGFDNGTMKSYFYRTLTMENATSTDIAAAYWGLAFLREPVLLDLNALVAVPGLKLTDKLYIALAYADIGALDTAERIYQEIIQKYMREDTLRAYLTVAEEGYDVDDAQEATSLCALLAQKINAEESDKFFAYVSNMYPTDILTSAMRLAYIKSNLKKVNMTSSFSWELDGRKEHVTINGRETCSMFLTTDKLSNIRFSNIKGKVTVATVYTAPIGEISKTDPRVTIERNYYDRTGKQVTSFDSSEYIKVSLKINFDPAAPSGRYMVEDYLPASLLYVSSYSEADVWLDNSDAWYPHEIFGQKVSFSLYHHNQGIKERTIEYFARVYNMGTYTADNAAVFNLEGNVINYAPRVKIQTGGQQTRGQGLVWRVEPYQTRGQGLVWQTRGLGRQEAYFCP